MHSLTPATTPLSRQLSIQGGIHPDGLCWHKLPLVAEATVAPASFAVWEDSDINAVKFEASLFH